MSSGFLPQSKNTRTYSKLKFRVSLRYCPGCSKVAKMLSMPTIRLNPGSPCFTFFPKTLYKSLQTFSQTDQRHKNHNLSVVLVSTMMLTTNLGEASICSSSIPHKYQISRAWGGLEHSTCQQSDQLFKATQTFRTHLIRTLNTSRWRLY